MKRDQFLQRALAGAAALFVVNWGTMAQIRQYKEQDKPLLTEANLNRFFAKYKSENNIEPFSEAIRDTKAFLQKYFSVSPEQKKTIDRLKEEDWKNIQSVINDAKEDKGILNFKFVQERVRECQTSIRLMQKTTNIVPANQPTGVKARTIPANNSQIELRKVVIQ